MLLGEDVTRSLRDWVKMRHYPVAGIAAAAKAVTGSWESMPALPVH